MKNFRTLIFTVATSALLIPLSVHSEEMDHSKMDHSKMHPEEMDHSKMDHAKKTEAVGKAVINAIDAEARSVNLTHEPMPELDWPKMTMDLPVTRNVDLSTTKPGDQVEFTIKLSRDKKYRIIKISPKSDKAPSPETGTAQP